MRRVNHRLLALMMAMVLMAVIAGCGGGKSAGTPTNEPATQPDSSTPSGTPSDTQATSPAPTEVQTVTIAGTDLQAMKHLPIFMDKFWSENGLKVEFKEYKGGSEVAKALLNGDVQFALSAVTHTLTDKSGEMRILSMVTNGPGHAIIVDNRYKDEIKSVKDLTGRKIGVSSLGSGPHKTLDQALVNAGVDPKSVTVLPVGLDTNQIFAEQKVVATVTLEPYITKAVEDGLAYVLLDTRKPEGIQEVYGVSEMPWIAVVSLQSLIDKNPDLVRQVVRTMSTAQQFIATASASDIAAVTRPEFKGADEKLFASIVMANKASFSADGRLTRTGLEAVWKSMQDSGAVPKDQAMPWDEVTRLDFLESAIAQK